MVITNKNNKKYIIGFLAGVLFFVVYGTLKSLLSFKKSSDKFEASEYKVYKAAEVENLKSFQALQIKIDSLEAIKEEKTKEIYNDSALDIQTKLNLIFNNNSK